MQTPHTKWRIEFARELAKPLQAFDGIKAIVIAGSVALLVIGIAIERLLIRHFYGRPHEDQLLVTFGLSICMVEIVRFFFGSLSIASRISSGTEPNN